MYIMDIIEGLSRGKRAENMIRNAGGFTAGAVFGLAAGIAAGLLIAPRPGSETRKELSETADRVTRKAADKIRNGKVKLRRRVGRNPDTSVEEREEK